eukprot:Protomagalhaensia_sp_Gyna_25__2764@NODE_2594_length_994_cov_61_238743_g2156_i0_p1_GENE_NODE_2594_length_994_cov_61_238743_g2156_i0NODE_2594_length_994_cov_61_238743_g2156_i0_p1_ORF_typecomplete_len289_score76_46Myb_DNAbind_7/PF15963_5/4_3e10RNA_pol_3_Rpc31/PF11705_8/0_05RNA_pol_3_Rpc31/PF11705_8/60Myb_DNAbinding/PF00249_31/1_8e04Myb_DNAbinding/PF00249_31/0_4_NODE_2594_length_994_cov_61_238743_g2156_i0128961
MLQDASLQARPWLRGCKRRLIKPESESDEEEEDEAAIETTEEEEEDDHDYEHDYGDQTLAPRFTSEGDLTVWGVICQNQDSERRKAKRRAVANAKLLRSQEAEEKAKQREAVLTETSGNDFLADMFCGKTESPDRQTKQESYQIKQDSMERPQEAGNDEYDIFAEMTTAVEDPLSNVGVVHDEWSLIMGGEVEVVNGDRVGRLNPFPGAYKKSRQHVWTQEETKTFFRALSMYGADLMMVRSLLVGLGGNSMTITDKDVAAKYRSETKKKGSRKKKR